MTTATLTGEGIKTRTYFAQVRKGREEKIAANIMKLKKCCRDIVRAVAMPFGGYVKVEVIANDDKHVIRKSALDLPKDTKTIIEMNSGVIKILGNGDEAIPEEEKVA